MRGNGLALRLQIAGKRLRLRSPPPICLVPYRSGREPGDRVTGLYAGGVGLLQALIGLGSIARIVLGERLADRPDRERYLPALLADSSPRNFAT